LTQYETRISQLLVFPNDSGNIDTHILEALKRICRKAGIKQSTVHALRHSFGAHLRMAGVSLADIADLLGHKDLATTQIYAKVHQEHLRAAVAKLGPVVPALALEAKTGQQTEMSPENVTGDQNGKEEECKLLKNRQLAGGTRKYGGEEGIRTLDTAFGPYNGLANRRLQPLGHLTAREVQE
jgi:Phage integrase family